MFLLKVFWTIFLCTFDYFQNLKYWFYMVALYDSTVKTYSIKSSRFVSLKA